MCTRQDVKEEIVNALSNNNNERNAKLDEKLQSLKLDIFEKVDESINKRLQHNTTAPETRKIFEQIKENCSNTTQKYNLTQQLMQEDLKHILKYIEEDASWKKDFSSDLRNNFVSKIEFAPVKKLVYGAVGATLMAVLIGLLALVIKDS